MAPKFGRGALFAYRHPWRVSLAAGLVMYTWAKCAVRVTTPQAILGGLVVITFILILWVPAIRLSAPLHTEVPRRSATKCRSQRPVPYAKGADPRSSAID